MPILKKNISVIVGAFILITMVSTAAFAEGALKTGDMITDDLMVSTLDGSSKSIKSVLDKPFTLLQFMTTACGACKSELTELRDFWEKRTDKLALIVISMDMNGAAAVNRYEKKWQFGVEYMLDTGFSLPPRFDLSFTPSFLVLDKTGKILMVKGGYNPGDWPAIESSLKEIMD